MLRVWFHQKRTRSSLTPLLAYARERNKRVTRVDFQKAPLVGWSGQDNLPFAASDIKELNNFLSPHIVVQM